VQHRQHASTAGIRGYDQAGDWLQSQENLNATNSQISIAGRANLQVGGTAQLQKRIITFDNPNETHPVMNVSVTTTVEQYNLTLTLRGPLDNPNATARFLNTGHFALETHVEEITLA
jgi:hypothetical protein